MAEEKTKPEIEVKKEVKVEEKKEVKKEETKVEEKIEEKEKTSSLEEKLEKQDKKEGKEVKKTKDKKEEKSIVKKYEAVSRGRSLPISKKQGMYICRFIKNKNIDIAIRDLTLVILKKKAVPFKGEIPHRKGLKGSGRYPIKACKYFISMLKGLKGNVIVNGLDLDNTRIYYASSNWAPRQLRREGRLAKRAHIIIKAKEVKKGGKK